MHAQSGQAVRVLYGAVGVVAALPLPLQGPLAVKEGREAWQGKGCCALTAKLVPSAGDEADGCDCRPGCDCCN
ncbi:hypothetical protein [Streptomyces javensis]|uniref:hypothetical protein n=1 Tax=Streptomyces javensis TaxID=114698 RepID=UPI002810A989|nr:hypothetical protein [Streptomyces javensis]